jgi:hypothetical protein
MRLPVVGRWRVYRTHYGAKNDQAWAVDLVIDGGSPRGRTKRNEDFGSYNQPIVAAAPGVVVIAADGIPDNEPPRVNPYDMQGNYVVLDHRNVRTRRALVAALSGDPGVGGGEAAPQRFDLADRTAFLMPVLVEAEQALFAHQCLYGLRVREHEFDREAVVLAHPLDEAQRLRMQASRVQAEDAHRVREVGEHVDEHHVLRAAEGQGERVEVLDRVGEHVARVGALERRVRSLDGEGVRGSLCGLRHEGGPGLCA